MKLVIFASLSLLLWTGCLLAQGTSQSTTTHEYGSPESNALSAPSLFHHLQKSTQQSNARYGPGSFCPLFWYYDKWIPSQYFTETLPSSGWAVRVTVPAAPCTVWTVNVDFEITGNNVMLKDTMDFFVREVNPPYTQIFSTYLLARYGVNEGQVEIDPPSVPPYNIRPEVNSARDVYVGLKIRGSSQHSVKWKFKSPSSYQSPVRSVRFTTPTTIVPASTIVGSSVDWVNEFNLCLPTWIPVELSAFTAQFERSFVNLTWRTESETNNMGFEVLRAEKPEGPWALRGFVRGNGSTVEPQFYEFQDNLSSQELALYSGSVMYYRLRQIDVDGTFEELPIKQVLLANPDESGYALYPVYPSPVLVSSGSPATFRYSLPNDAYIRIAVYDLLGREVAVLANQFQTAGLHHAFWFPSFDGAALSAGQYLVRLQAGAQILTRTFVVQR